MKILEQENSHLHKLLELAEYDSGTTAAIAGSGVAANNPNQMVNGDGGRGMFIIKSLGLSSKNPTTYLLRMKHKTILISGSSSSMGSYFRGENLSDFELDELNSGNESGNDNVGK